MKQRQIRRRRAHATPTERERMRRYYGGVQWSKHEQRALRRTGRAPIAFNRSIALIVVDEIKARLAREVLPPLQRVVSKVVRPYLPEHP